MGKTSEEYFYREFHCALLSIAPRNDFKQKVLEARLIMESSLNVQMNSDVLLLFRNRIT